jgi:pSer/pThr/pTyr-binding forkhead associated (FHA) protein
LQLDPAVSEAEPVVDTTGSSNVSYPLISPETLIGRLDSVDLVLEDPAVSRVHAKIVRESNGWVIVDLESSCGTNVNGERITRHRLRDGDVIEIASARLEYRE